MSVVPTFAARFTVVDFSSAFARFSAKFTLFASGLQVEILFGIYGRQFSLTTSDGDDITDVATLHQNTLLVHKVSESNIECNGNAASNVYSSAVSCK